MALVREVDTLDEVPEYAKAGYKQVGEKWVNEDVEDISGLKGALRKERETGGLTAKELAAYKASGLTPEQFAEIKAKADQQRDEGGKPDIEKLIEKRIAQLRKEEFDPVVAERDSLRQENRKLLLTDEIRAAFLAAGGLEEDADDVVRLYEDRFELGEKSEKGKRKIIVKDDDGDPTGQAPKEWFEKQLKVKKPKYFKGTGASGGGASGGGSGGATGAVTLTRAAAKDPAVYRAAKEKATKEGRPFVLTD